MFKSTFNIFTSVTSSEVSSTISSLVEDSSTASDASSENFIIAWNSIWNNIVNWVMTTGLKIIIGLIILFILFKITNAFSNHILRKMELKQCDKTITQLTYSVIRICLKVLFVILFVSYIGIDTAAIGSIISSVGIGFSLAVQGSLSNFAGGIVIVVMRPFGVGDVITAQGCTGTVEKIKLFYTYVVSGDNKVQMIPNGTLANGVIVNTSVKEARRVDLNFTISYNSSIDEAKKIIIATALNNSKIFKTPEPFVGVSEFADSEIVLISRVWVKNGDYWDTVFSLNQAVYEALVKGGIEIPYPQMDVHIDKINQ